MECVFLMLNHVEDRRTFKINSHSLLKTSQNSVDMGLPQRYTLLHYTTLETSAIALCGTTGIKDEVRISKSLAIHSQPWGY